MLLQRGRAGVRITARFAALDRTIAASGRRRLAPLFGGQLVGRRGGKRRFRPLLLFGTFWRGRGAVGARACTAGPASDASAIAAFGGGDHPRRYSGGGRCAVRMVG